MSDVAVTTYLNNNNNIHTMQKLNSIDVVMATTRITQKYIEIVGCYDCCHGNCCCK